MVQSTLDSGRNVGVTQSNYAILVTFSKTARTWRSVLGNTIVMVLLCHSSECGCLVCNTWLFSGDFPCYFLFRCQETSAFHEHMRKSEELQFFVVVIYSPTRQCFEWVSWQCCCDMWMIMESGGSSGLERRSSLSLSGCFCPLSVSSCNAPE